MTSKVDNPPAYEDALQDPKYEPTPLQHGSSDAPPPSDSPGPGMYPGPPGYWSQAGMWAAPGLSPSGMPTTIPTLSASITATNPREMEGFLSTQWDSTSVRHAFIRKGASQDVCYQVSWNLLGIFSGLLYRLLHSHMLQRAKEALSMESGVVGSFYCCPILYVWNNFKVCLSPLLFYTHHTVIVMFFLFCFKHPMYLFSSYYETKAVLLAMGITALVCVTVTVFCFQTKVDFTSCGGFLCIAAILLVILGMVTSIVLAFHYVPWLHMLYAAIGAIVYTLFLVYNTQLLIGNRELAISPEEYVYGALSLYIDIVHIFLFILQISGSATD
ncbi:protein lifeguard 3 isoform 2-T3 [Syngnathus typhle]